MLYTNQKENLIFKNNVFTFNFESKQVNYKYNLRLKESHKCLNSIDNVIFYENPRIEDWISKMEDDVNIVGYKIGGDIINLIVNDNNLKIKTDIEIYIKNSKHNKDISIRNIYLFLLNPLTNNSFTLLTDDEISYLNPSEKIIYNQNLKIVDYEYKFLSELKSWCDKKNVEMFLDYGDQNFSYFNNNNLIVN